MHKYFIFSGLAIAFALPAYGTSSFSFAVLANGNASDNTGPGNATIFGDVGGTSLSNWANATVNGTLHNNDATVTSGIADLNTQFTTFSGMSVTGHISTDVSGNINAQTVTPGVYDFRNPSNSVVSTPNLAHVITLNGAGQYVFLANGLNDFTSGGGIVATNGASAAQVFVVITNSVSFSVSITEFDGSILAGGFIGLDGGTFNGSVLSKNGVGLNGTTTKITAQALEAVPEPSSFILAFAGVAALVARKRLV